MANTTFMVGLKVGPSPVAALSLIPAPLATKFNTMIPPIMGGGPDTQYHDAQVITPSAIVGNAFLWNDLGTVRVPSAAHPLPVDLSALLALLSGGTAKMDIRDLVSSDVVSVVAQGGSFPIVLTDGSNPATNLSLSTGGRALRVSQVDDTGVAFGPRVLFGTALPSGLPGTFPAANRTLAPNGSDVQSQSGFGYYPTVCKELAIDIYIKGLMVTTGVTDPKLTLTVYRPGPSLTYTVLHTAYFTKTINPNSDPAQTWRIDLGLGTENNVSLGLGPRLILSTDSVTAAAYSWQVVAK